ncbi:MULTISPECIES: sulfite exporter TauE/SafE family protein [unclassified Thermoactinomyces]|uniref:sulfite exporter TauE/SafE family protein n=1 Tax=unclassified Thermoactinomyces TaxID=2634588 RepID=UPI0018DC57E0|nr:MULTISPECIES: sulfite exporter TauE/SafE family protein [unclassified Thermoactinomyces]MBH8598627.1 sulfite exporter TauE/SafE family protein [Thermoactinomyces sp. CICC 10523]MBH8605117.1 sulfite exporter TauE/SafE family protein [Thermoactinomyces sp. CICC 10522]MBH8609067.1 sulfite exporter TauE/SafE family protein [Thermoactinomyces sp. CICC 10521]
MDIGLMILIFFIGFIGSFTSGMLGIGGSIINYPMLLYVPPLLGFTAFTAHEVTGIGAVQVFFATLTAVLAYRKEGYLNKSLVLYMGISILIGSFIGGYGSKLLSEGQINLIYAILATIAALMMFVPKKGLDDIPVNQVKFHVPLAIISAFIIGIASGIIGAAGAFILVPVMLVVLKIPTRMTIATSLAITFISSVGSASAKIVTGQIDLIPAIVLVIASIVASPLGATVGKKVNPKTLQVILSIVIVATSVKIWFDFL